MKAMLHEAGIEYRALAADLRRGVYYQRVALNRPFTTEEIEALPPKHAAQSNPGLIVERSVLAKVDLPPFEIIENAADVIFRGAAPIVGDRVEVEGYG